MDAYERVADPGLRYLQLCSRVLALTARKVADEPTLPHDFVGTARALLDGHDRVREDEAYQELVVRAATDRNVTLDRLEEAIEEMAEAAEAWTARVSDVDSQDPMSVRAFNDQVMQVNAVLAGAFGPAAKRDIGTAVAFPKILETLDELSMPNLPAEVEEEKWEKLRADIFDLVVMIKQAVDLMQEFHHL